MAPTKQPTNSRRMQHPSKFFYYSRYKVLVADWIKSATFFGCETMGIWLDSISSTVAPIIFAVARSNPGLIIWSSVATMHQLGLDFQAAVEILVTVAWAAQWTWVA